MLNAPGEATMTTLVLGIGNLLLADEGVGVHAARVMMQGDTKEGVEVLEVGTDILAALPELERAHRVIVVDAVKGGGRPGSVYRIPFHECARPTRIASMHGFDLSRVLALARREDRPEVVVIGVEPARIDWSLELSAEVERALPAVMKAVREETGDTGGQS